MSGFSDPLWPVGLLLAFSLRLSLAEANDLVSVPLGKIDMHITGFGDTGSGRIENFDANWVIFAPDGDAGPRRFDRTVQRSDVHLFTNPENGTFYFAGNDRFPGEDKRFFVFESGGMR